MKTNRWTKLFMAAFAICAMLPVVASAQCTPQVGTSSVALSAAGGYFSVAIYAPAGCPWTMSEGSGWMTIVNGRSGYGSGAVTVYVAGNGTRRSRSAVMSLIRPGYNSNTIGGRTSTVSAIVAGHVSVVEYP